MKKIEENIHVYMKEVTYPDIDENGHIVNKRFRRFYLKDFSHYGRLTKSYFSLRLLNEDLYSASELTIFDGCPDIKSGVISLTRDRKGKIEKYSERVIVPFVFDDIHYSLNGYAFGFAADKCCLLDLNPQSKRFGKQITPVLLNIIHNESELLDSHLSLFFGCSINGVNGFLPYQMSPANTLTEDDLLSMEEICYLSEIASDIDNWDIKELKRMAKGKSLKLK